MLLLTSNKMLSAVLDGVNRVVTLLPTVSTRTIGPLTVVAYRISALVLLGAMPHSSATVNHTCNVSLRILVSSRLSKPL
jgi:hypothetical protein